MKTEKIDVVIKPFERILHHETSAGIVLLVSAVAAMAWANSPWRDSYHHLWEQSFAFSVAGYTVSNTLHHWINDGLMAMFFFVVGLELKREMIAGELSTFKTAVLPLVAAFGGMLAPALFFIVFNPSAPQSAGWGIPMATDIAFALGVVSLLGPRVPLSLKVFLTALAVADDLGAVLVIAFFYTSDISVASLGLGGVFLLFLITANYLGVRSWLFYGLVGIGGLWMAFLFSGIHATLAGVLAAFAIPARTKVNEKDFVDTLSGYIQEFRSIPSNDLTLLEPAQSAVIEKINKLTTYAATPLQRLEHAMHPWVAFGVMPLFALANAGISLRAEAFSATFFQGITMGVLTGLVAGKLLGVVLFTWGMVKLRWASLPAGMTLRHLWGAGLLAGIGFTMSLFIAGLAYTDAELINEAKVGIFAGSIISGCAGYFYLRGNAGRAARL